MATFRGILGTEQAYKTCTISEGERGIHMPDEHSELGSEPTDDQGAPRAERPETRLPVDPTRDLESARALLAATSDALLLVSHSGRIEWASRGLTRVLGYRPEDIVGTELFTYVHPDDLRSAVAAFQKVTKGDPDTEASVVRALHASGDYRWVEATAADVVDDPHLGGGVVLSIRDTTQRKETEDELRSSEHWFKALIQHTTDGFVTIGPGTTIIYASPGVERILGRTAEDLVGTNGLDLLIDQDRDRVAGGLASVLTKPGHAVEEHVRIKHPDMGSRWIDVEAVNLLEDPDIQGIIVTFRDTTDSRIADEAVRASEKRFKTLVQNSSEVVLILDEAANVSYASLSLEQVLGFAPADVIGAPGLGAIHPDDADIAAETMAGVMTTPGVPTTAEARVRHADGSWRLVEARLLNLLHDPDVEGIVATVHDITERQLTATALRDSEVRFRAVVANGRDVTTILDIDGHITWSTPKVEAMLGYTVDELIGVSALDLVHPDEVELALTDFTRTVDGTNDTYPLPLRIRHKDGSWIPLDVLTADIRSDSGAPEGIVLTVRDASWRVEAQEAARRSEARFRALVQHSSDGILVTDRASTISYASASVERLFGRSPAELMDMDGLAFVHPDDREMIEHDLAMLMDRPGEIITRQFRVLPHDGTIRWIEATVVNMLADEDVQGIVTNIRDMSERKAMEERLEHAASHDPLTGLPNRTLLYDRLRQAFARAKRARRSVGLLFIDLDDFKLLNDTYGHSFGDKALVAVAERIAGALRGGDTVARFGGDEFIVLCEQIDSIDEAREVAERLQLLMTGPMTIGGEEIIIEMSTGVAVTDDTEADPDDLIRNADLAMYSAKDGGRGRVETFDADGCKSVFGHLDVESAMREALERKEISVRYQPVFDLSTNEVCRVDATPRWDHAERGLLAAGELVDLAEATGLIVPIGTWLLEEACRDVWRWSSDLCPDDPLQIGVTLSARQLEDPELIDKVGRLATVSGIDANQLHLDIPESVLVADADRVGATLESLARKGVNLGVDELDTYSSSLSYLRRFPVDSLKIDASLVDEPAGSEGNAAIVGAIIRLAHTLGMKVTAVGIETDAQLHELRRQGTDRGQGPLLGGVLDPVGTRELLTELILTPGRRAPCPSGHGR